LLQSASGAVSSSSGQKGTAKVRILVVEDNGINRTVALSQLEALGYLGEAVENGRQALEALERESYDLVLMDCQMPVMDGYAAVRRLRRREKGDQHIPVIAVTAHALKGERQRCLRAGMDDFLAKPLRLHELAASLERWLPSKQVPSIELGEIDQSVTPGSAPLESLEQDGIDFETIVQIRQLGRDLGRDLLSQVVGSLLDSLPGRLDRLREFHTAGESSGVEQLAHSLKGSSGNAGATGLSRIFSELQDKPTGRNVESLIQAADEELLRIGPRLRQQLKDV
jgi:CheY-like chemotaxis protein/HPt (histidine-containing phosphotransfer) domain-containing protein